MSKKPVKNQRLTTASGRRIIDWQRIEADHSTGRYTDQELADAHGVQRAVLSRHRSKARQRDPSSWAVDRSADVARATQALLAHQQITEVVTKGNAAESVLTAALASRDVILRHRTDLAQARDVAMRLLCELDATTTMAGELAKAFEVATSDLAPEEKAGLREQFKGLMKLHARASSVHKLADSLQKVQTMERKAFGIEDASDKAQDRQRALSDVERAARIAAFVERARAARAAAEPSVPDALVGDPAAPGEHPAAVH